MTGYSLEAEDRRVGTVADMLMEEGSYAIRYLIVDTQRDLSGEPVLIAPGWVSGVSWIDASIHVPVAARTVAESPGAGKVDPPIARELEVELYRYYRSKGYWETGPSEARH